MISQLQVIYFSISIPIFFAIMTFKSYDNNLTLVYFIYTFGCFLSYFLTLSLIPVIKNFNLKADLYGMDINKKGTEAGDKKVPESMGIVPSVVFMIIGCLGTILIKNVHQEMLCEHIAGLLSICFIIFLGFADDVLDLPWRYKIILPTIACLPILVAYTGITKIIVPFQLRFLLGSSLELGPLYFIYMGLLSIFCTNSINIYAGINGLEVGQSLVIACAIIVHNLIEIYYNNMQHCFSLVFMIPYLFCSLGLFKFNIYPSQVFVGDIFCYWSGVTFAVSGILGHFSKTLLLFFLPQIINFLYSIPQLLKIIPCPRHRMPRFNLKTGLLEDSNNLTLINLYLKLAGPTNERDLCTILLIFQIICCGFGFFIRYYISQFFFE